MERLREYLANCLAEFDCWHTNIEPISEYDKGYKAALHDIAKEFFPDDHDLNAGG